MYIGHIELLKAAIDCATSDGDLSVIVSVTDSQCPSLSKVKSQSLSVTVRISITTKGSLSVTVRFTLDKASISSTASTVSLFEAEIMRGGGEGLMGVASTRGNNYTSVQSMASCLQFNFAVPDMPSSPYHPSETFSFSKRSFRKMEVVWQSFQPAWCRIWPFHTLRMKLTTSHVFVEEL